MNHTEYLMELLYPLGVYDLSPGTINRGELAAYGRELDGAREILDIISREMNLTTAESFGLDFVEGMLAYRLPAQPLKWRRQALAALLRIGGDSFTLDAINDALKSCGVNVQVMEETRPAYVTVYFPDVQGVPENLERLQTLVEELLPCHLGIGYAFWNVLWSQLEQNWNDWNQAEGSKLSWRRIAMQSN